MYVSNRGHNSVAVFKVKEDRTLEAAGHITGDITIPRNFNIDPSGKWVLIASQDGGKVGVWERDAATGGAKETGVTVPVSRCVCVKFVRWRNKAKSPPQRRKSEEFHHKGTKINTKGHRENRKQG